MIYALNTITSTKKKSLLMSVQNYAVFVKVVFQNKVLYYIKKILMIKLKKNLGCEDEIFCS